MEELITYFSIFDGFEDLSLLKSSDDLLENIKTHILQDFQNRKKSFIFSDDPKLQKDIEKMLHTLSIGDRKRFSLYKNISRFRGMEGFKLLYEKDIIRDEITREKPLKKEPFHRLKKSLRGYRVEDKIRFNKEYHRFWFTFIYPYYGDLEKSEYNRLLQEIRDSLPKFVSGFFEELSNELIIDIFKDEIEAYGGYWTKDLEIDLLIELIDGRVIAGECKWKNHKVSKNILNKLRKITKKADFRVDSFALFSKSGFSKELKSLDSKEVMLYDLDSFKRLLV
jgi:hypothetical protein